jgi:predicted AlkP superfamily phosphohydrolase/phosphomutase
MTTGRRPKMLVIGLDCAEPSLVFDRWRDELPTLGRLMARGTYGPLESCVPCITVPAWACMMSGQDPGQLGLYGFNNRVGHTYRSAVMNAAALDRPLVFDRLSAEGLQVVVVGVPPSYPLRPVNGVRVGCFLTPDTRRPFTSPAEVSDELRALVGDYPVDVDGFRTHDKAALRDKLYQMTDAHFTAIRHLMTTRLWDFFMFVEIGVDRVHHGFWRYHDPAHRWHEAGSPFRDTIHDYYRHVDAHLGKLLRLIDDDTVIVVVSDHGARRMEGGICINEWLAREGFLMPRSRPAAPTPFEKCEIDWSRTTAWGGGGYYGRIFLNVKGREPEGCVDPRDYDRVRDDLAARLEALTDHEGRPLGSRVFRPERIYRECRGVPPDLLVYFGNLAWRSIGSLGHESVCTFENDTGPDDANHAPFGLFIHVDPRRPGAGRVPPLHLSNIAPAILHHFGIAVPDDMIGGVPDFIVTNGPGEPTPAVARRR